MNIYVDSVEVEQLSYTPLQIRKKNILRYIHNLYTKTFFWNMGW